MPVKNIINVDAAKALHRNLPESKHHDMGEIVRIVKEALKLPGEPVVWKGSPGACGSHPLSSWCILILVKGLFKLDDEQKMFTGEWIGVEIEGSKILYLGSNAEAIWFPGGPPAEAAMEKWMAEVSLREGKEVKEVRVDSEVV